MIEEKHGAAVRMVILNAESKICLMMLPWSTMRITKRWPLMDLIHNIVTLVDPLSSTNKSLTEAGTNEELYQNFLNRFSEDDKNQWPPLRFQNCHK